MIDKTPVIGSNDWLVIPHCDFVDCALTFMDTYLIANIATEYLFAVNWKVFVTPEVASPLVKDPVVMAVSSAVPQEEPCYFNP